MKFKPNRIVIYDSNSNPTVVAEAGVLECTLKGTVFPAYYGWRIYWDLRIISEKVGEKVAILTEGPIGWDTATLNFLEKNKWFETKCGSDHGQLIVEHEGHSESGDHLQVCWNLLKKGELNVRCQTPHESRWHVAVAASCFFEGLSFDQQTLGSGMLQVPKDWDIQLRQEGRGRTVIHPLNFNKLAKQLTY
jgi:hypothetical protein